MSVSASEQKSIRNAQMSTKTFVRKIASPQEKCQFLDFLLILYKFPSFWTPFPGRGGGWTKLCGQASMNFWAFPRVMNLQHLCGFALGAFWATCAPEESQACREERAKYNRERQVLNMNPRKQGTIQLSLWSAFQSRTPPEPQMKK